MRINKALVLQNTKIRYSTECIGLLEAITSVAETKIKNEKK
jgi:hypothetical protein